MGNRGTVFHRNKITMLLALLVIVVGGYFLFGGAVYYWKEYVPHYEAGAASRLIALHRIEENYRKDHGTYAGSFSELGVPLGAQLVGDALIWDSPYRFRVINTVRGQAGSIQDYQIEARPNQYSNQCKRSFLMDSSGYIHFTVHNRKATLSDPAIPPEN
jgi:hypothetical protein